MNSVVQNSSLSLLLASVAFSAVAESPPLNALNFVACPIVRDTKSVPCWLAEYEGETYFLVIQANVYAPVTPPWLGHKVLVEGVVSAEESICGGKVLKPVTLSVLPELDASCNTILPAEEAFDLKFTPRMPPGPPTIALDFAFPAPIVNKPGDGPKDFTIKYDFNGLIVFRHTETLLPILNYARQTEAKRVAIVGYRSSTLLSSGQRMTENDGIGKRRAEEIAELLKGAGLTEIQYDIRWDDVAAATTGTDGPATRRVTVRVE